MKKIKVSFLVIVIIVIIPALSAIDGKEVNQSLPVDIGELQSEENEPILTNQIQNTKKTAEKKELIPKKYEYQEGDYQNNFSNSILNKDMYDGRQGGFKEAGIEYPEISLQPELQDYFAVDENDGEGKYDQLVSIFFDPRTLEMKEDELLDLFIKHGYFLYFHQGKIAKLTLRIIEIQEIDGLSLFPARIIMQSWDEKYLYMQDITSDIPRKVRNLLTIDNGEFPRIILHTSGFNSYYVPEEELIFFAFRRTGWVLSPLELKIDYEAAHVGGSLYPDLDREQLFSPTYYSDGIAFSSSTQSVGGRYIYQETFRLGILEEIEKNKRFRMRGINEVVGVTVDRRCHIDFTIVE